MEMGFIFLYVFWFMICIFFFFGGGGEGTGGGWGVVKLCIYVIYECMNVCVYEVHVGFLMK